MEIVKNHYIPGARVKRYSQIKKDADKMLKIINLGAKGILFSDGYGLAHNQVESKKPFAFFVLSDNALKFMHQIKHNVIINPEIISAPEEINIGKNIKGKEDIRTNKRIYEEGCFSFPHKKPKKVERFYQIMVKYQVKGSFGLKTIENTIDGLDSHIFQHEEQHCRGKNIYYKK